MIIDCRSSTNGRMLTVFCDDEPWREIHPSIFGRRPSFPKEVETGEWERLFAGLEYRSAKNYAVRRLSAHSLPSASLARSLRQRLVSENTIVRIVDEFSSQGYLNDRDWAASFARVQSARKVGPKAIAMKLAGKGIDKEYAAAALESFSNEDKQKESIMLLLNTKYKKRDLSDFKEKQKVVASLIRRGFDYELVLAQLNS